MIIIRRLMFEVQRDKVGRKPRCRETKRTRISCSYPLTTQYFLNQYTQSHAGNGNRRLFRKWY
jgi:hypothetical protein